MKLKINNVYTVLEIADNYLKTYNMISNNDYNHFIRMYTDGSGILYFILNNLDIKLVMKVNIDSNISFDKMYKINELFTVLKGMKVYEEVEYDYVNDVFKFFNDASFLLHEITLDERTKEVMFSSEELSVEDNESSVIDDTVKNEFSNIKKIIDLKKKDSPNYFCYKDDDIYFNLFDIYVKKLNNFKNIYTDIIGFKFLIFIFEKTTSSHFIYGKNGKKFIFKFDDFYIEGININCDDGKKTLLYNFFDKLDVKTKFEVKLEFYNFVSTVMATNNKCGLVFNNNTKSVSIQSHDNSYNAEFNIDGISDFFVISIYNMNKILNFILKYVSKIDHFKFILGLSEDSKWLVFKVADITLMTELKITSMEKLKEAEEDDIEFTEED